MRDSVVVLSRAGSGSLCPEQVGRIRAVADLDFVVRHHAPDPQEAVQLLGGATVLATTNITLPLLDEWLLSRLPRLRWVVLYATGHEHVDEDLLHRHGVALITLPTYATTAVAEHALGLVLALATRVHLANDRSRGRVPEGASLRGVELAGRTLGVVGVGRIGSHLARLGSGIGMRVVGSDVDARARSAARAQGVETTGTDDLLARADVVALCASTSRREPTIVDADRVRALRPGAFLVNIGRPALVDTEAIAEALRSGRLRGYAVDDVVLDPVRHRDLLDEGRVLQTAHCAWWRDEVLERGARQFGEAILDVVQALAQERVA